MRVVVDTNIVFSALMNADNMMGEILLNADDRFRFYAPELLVEELTATLINCGRHRSSHHVS